MQEVSLLHLHPGPAEFCSDELHNLLRGTLSLLSIAEPPNPAPILCLPPASSSETSERPSRLPIPKNPRVSAGSQEVEPASARDSPRGREAAAGVGLAGGRAGAAILVSGASPPHLSSALAPPPAGGGRPAGSPESPPMLVPPAPSHSAPYPRIPWARLLQILRSADPFPQVSEQCARSPLCTLPPIAHL